MRKPDIHMVSDLRTEAKALMKNFVLEAVFLLDVILSTPAVNTNW